MKLPSQGTLPGPTSVPDATNIASGVNEADMVINLKPPDMISEASQFSLYEKRLKRWSRLSSFSKQRQFDLILSMEPTSNPLCEKLEEEIGDSSEAQDKGVVVIIDKLKEWFGVACFKVFMQMGVN